MVNFFLCQVCLLLYQVSKALNGWKNNRASALDASNPGSLTNWPPQRLQVTLEDLFIESVEALALDAAANAMLRVLFQDVGADAIRLSEIIAQQGLLQLFAQKVMEGCIGAGV